MKQRVITALILAPLVVLGIFKLPLTIFIIALSFITLLGFWEWTQFIDLKYRISSLIPPVILGGLSLYLLTPQLSMTHDVSPLCSVLLWVGSGWWVLASYFAMTYPASSRYWSHSKWLKQIFGLFTLLPFFWSVVLLRTEDMAQDFTYGAKLVLFVCLVVWIADSGAYFAGRFLGKHKMAPRVSPNKTLEGLAGGVFTAVIAAYFLSGWFDIHFTSHSSMFVIILCTVIFSVLGDLVESMFKRMSGIKDSSHLIPGHGGVLDRIDSLTAAFPVFAFLYFQL
ncbi:Phosphatidate cytidylyltransferase [Vibrio aerogenes CECT 7868]|uniref:Phosphatidate cytidylyltransferase n=1 Tax=Vibrio aerogenes CECT 7868 TaxID=1216006 RepID=A0A1M5WGX0_9VIBR|nr:phosphatidate cytidylyltransferase [Vibrio aerogenes]SHH86725.1 Phosphatidate cytidylyltransferase [Vibrio aerogenes CECT 7868]